MYQGAMVHEGSGLGFLVPLLLVSVPFAIGFYKVAGRLGKEKWLWAILSLVPVVNYFFWVYAWFVLALYVIDRLGDIEAAVVRGPGAPGPAARA